MEASRAVQGRRFGVELLPWGGVPKPYNMGSEGAQILNMLKIPPQAEFFSDFLAKIFGYIRI